MHPEYMRYQRKVVSDSQDLIDAASKYDEFGVKAKVDAMFRNGRHTNDQISTITARAIARLERRSAFFEVTLVEAMGNYIDYLLTLGPEKVTSEHIAGAIGLMNAVEELMVKYKEGQ